MLDQALETPDRDRESFLKFRVFTDDFIDAHIGLKVQDVTAFRGAM